MNPNAIQVANPLVPDNQNAPRFYLQAEKPGGAFQMITRLNANCYTHGFVTFGQARDAGFDVLQEFARRARGLYGRISVIFEDVPASFRINNEVLMPRMESSHVLGRIVSDTNATIVSVRIVKGVSADEAL